MLALSQRLQQCKHGYLTRREAAKVAKRKSFDPSVQVRVLKTLDISYSHSMASVLPSRHSSYTQFSASTQNACRRMTRCRVSSASGTKAGTTSKTIFQTQDVEFLFLSQRARRAAFGRSILPKTPVLKLNRPFARKPPAAIASELTRVACAPFAKPQVAGLRHS